MQIKQFDINLDIKKTIEADTKIVIVQKDSKTTVFYISITDFGREYPLQYVEQIQVVFRDRAKKIVIQEDVTVEDNDIVCVLNDEVMNMTIGEVAFEVVLRQGERKITTERKYFYLRDSIYYKRKENGNG